MNAQMFWNMNYRLFKSSTKNSLKTIERYHMRELAREAALERIIARQEREINRFDEVCEWRLYDDDYNGWASACGTEWRLEDGGPKENDMIYCVKCGRHIVEALS